VGPARVSSPQVGYSQLESVLLKKTALVAGALSAIVPTAGLFPLPLDEWRWPQKPINHRYGSVWRLDRSWFVF
jgi:hypothetical protein